MSGRNNDGVEPFAMLFGSSLDVFAVGGDRVSHALWRAGPGGALAALGAAGTAEDIFLLVGLNDVLDGVGSGVVGGLLYLARQDWDSMPTSCIIFQAFVILVLQIFNIHNIIP